ncbi:uncharacterized protein [Antedon mediterranea]|uniref:uncharacterized protein n=1 Tax=Antedon mediterranea TaxID=105859 RepID=UPI003AF78B2C
MLAMSEPEPTPEQEQEPEPEPESVATEPEPENEANAEPVPDWDEARELWSWAWQLHTYGFGLAFTALMLFSVMRMYFSCRSCRGKVTNAVALRLILFGCLILTTGFRSISLLVDPYGSCSKLSGLTINLLWSLTFPFLSAALNLLLFILLETTKLTTCHDHSRNMIILAFGTCIYIVVTITTDIIIALVKEVKGLMLFCQLVFVVWSTTIMIGFCFVCYKVKSNLRNANSVKKTDTEERRVTLFLRRVSACACTGFLFMAAQLYSIFGVFGVLSTSDEKVDPWSWWVFQTCMRTIEIAMCCLIHALVGNDSKYTSKLKSIKMKISKRWNSVINRSSSAVKPFNDSSTNLSPTTCYQE